MRVLKEYLGGPGKDAFTNNSVGNGPKDVNYPSLEFRIISLVSVANNLDGFEITALKLYIQVFVFSFFFNILVNNISKPFLKTPNKQIRTTKKVTAIEEPQHFYF